MIAPSHPTLGLALGGGGARGLAHIHVLMALDDLGLRPSHIAGTSIGAIIGAAYAAGMTGAEIREHTIEAFGTARLVAGRIWATRPPSLADFFADGGFRLGQLNAERVLAAFLPRGMPRDFALLSIPLTVMATDFDAGAEVAIESGPLFSALAASAALPALFRPVKRDGRILLDGGIFNPLPFDRLCGRYGLVVACDVTGGPEGLVPGRIPTPMEALTGASQLMMRSVIRTRMLIQAPDIFVAPKVSRYGVLDFLRARTILSDTAGLREEVKVAIGRRLESGAASCGGDETTPSL
ncbi:Patatin [Aureimonas sp. Leaf454]|uniref:patatin-like phospholipase family protein n=1 Tax=Aureimonas sp. Leaf454 TaxID=1736381 RepID=UPI0006FBB0ED|nr:patatin-like phospholipase family protein [Aureimonas sp. Leaf454]KQT54828.1 Patatin [Aureimonas sp. Leaf454]